mgnify:CR=1 FL=1
MIRKSLVAAAFLACASPALAESPFPADAEVYFISPSDGDTVAVQRVAGNPLKYKSGSIKYQYKQNLKV